MTNKTEHTPVPWRLVLSDNATPHINHGEGDDWADFGDLSSRVLVMPAEIVSSYNSLANARFIVKACNHHYRLVEALNGLLDMWDGPLFMEWQEARTLLEELEKQQ